MGDGAARAHARARPVASSTRASASTTGTSLSFYPRTHSLGVVLPSNSPGVHSLWVPAIALKIPLVLKPGSAEPWTPFRIAQAFMKAGCPPEAFSYYPADHAGAGEILRRTGRSMFFGDVTAVGALGRAIRASSCTGPGYSKVLIGDDLLDDWEQHVDLIAALDRRQRRPVVRQRLGRLGRRRRTPSGSRRRWPQRLAHDRAARGRRRAGDAGAVRGPEVAERISAQIDAGLADAGRARGHRATTGPAPRLATFDGCTYLLPTVVLCDCAEHPLANREFLFPFAAVVTVSPTRWRACREPMGKTLVVTALTARSRPGRPAARVAARRSAERRPDPDQPDQLGSAARRQPVRAPLRAAVVPAACRRRAGRSRRRVRILSFTGGAGEHVLRQLPARQRARRGAARAAATTSC